jgi:MFS family permease
MASPARLFTRGFTLVWTASLLYNAGFQLIGAALPLYAVSLGATDGQVGLLIGLFALAAMAGRTVVGWQLDRGSKRLVLVAGNLIFVASALGYAAVTAVAPLLALRVLNGAGHAAGQAANQTLATETAPPERRGEALAMQLLTLSLSLATMPALGVAIAGAFGFPALFLVTAGLSLLAALVALLCPEPPPPVVRSPAQFFNVAVIRPGLILLALMIAFGAVVGLAAVHAARVGLVNPGLFFLAYAGGLIVAQSFGGRLSDRRGRAAAILPGLALAALGMAAIALARAWWLLPAAALFGLGVGLAQSSLIALAADYVPPARRGSAIATSGIFLEGGISAGATAGGLIGQAAGLPAAFLALGLLPALALVALVATGWGRRTLSPPTLVEAAATR